MQQTQSSELLMNNAQTCIFYALNLMFDYHKIDPSPIITRNTNFTDGHQLNAFFKHIITLETSIPCKYSVLRKTDLPDNCVLVFRNQHNEFIHAAFCQKNQIGFIQRMVCSLRLLSETYAILPIDIADTTQSKDSARRG